MSVKKLIISGFGLLLVLISIITVKGYLSVESASRGFVAYEQLANDAIMLPICAQSCFRKVFLPMNILFQVQKKL